jgi:hypothetical protein
MNSGWSSPLPSPESHGVSRKRSDRSLQKPTHAPIYVSAFQPPGDLIHDGFPDSQKDKTKFNVATVPIPMTNTQPAEERSASRPAESWKLRLPRRR